MLGLVYCMQLQDPKDRTPPKRSNSTQKIELHPKDRTQGVQTNLRGEHSGRGFIIFFFSENKETKGQWVPMLVVGIHPRD